MLPYELIVKKRDEHTHTEQEIDFLVKGFTHGRIEEAQTASWLMAAFIRGLDREETRYLTESMVKSGSTIDLSRLVGDKLRKRHADAAIIPARAVNDPPVMKAADQLKISVGAIPVSDGGGKPIKWRGDDLPVLDRLMVAEPVEPGVSLGALWVIENQHPALVPAGIVGGADKGRDGRVKTLQIVKQAHRRSRPLSKG